MIEKMIQSIRRFHPRGKQVSTHHFSQGDVRDLGFHLKWNMGFTHDAVSLFSADFNERTKLETFGWKRLAWLLGLRSCVRDDVQRKRMQNM